MTIVFRKSLLILIALAVCVSGGLGPQARAQPPTQPVYSALWEPIAGSQVRTSIYNNANNALALQDLWWRAALYDQTGDYMTALGQVVQKQPTNANATAVYAIALYDLGVARYRSGHPDTFQPRLDDSPAAVQRVLDKAKKLAPRLWLIPLGESRLIPGPNGNFATMWKDKVNLARRAFWLKKNPQTYVNLAQALVARSANERSDQVLKQALRTLEQARKAYPTNPKVLAELYTYYHAEKNPKTEEVKADLIATIRPPLRGTSSVQRYFKQIGLE